MIDFESPYKNRTIEFLEENFLAARNALESLTGEDYEAYQALIHSGRDEYMPKVANDELRRMALFDYAIGDMVHAVDLILDEGSEKIRGEYLNVTRTMTLIELPEILQEWYMRARAFLDGADFVCQQQLLWGEEMAKTK
jgi:hypothetical protein